LLKDYGKDYYYKKVWRTSITSQYKNPDLKEIKIDNRYFNYVLKRSGRAKYLRLQINIDNQLEVILPRRASINDAKKFIKEKEYWISKHLKNSAVENKKYFFFGRQIRVTHSFDLFENHHSVRLLNNELRIISPANNSDDTSKVYDLWLKKIAKKYLIQRTNELTLRHGLSINKIILRGQKTRWGSCSTKGNVSFNYRLMKFRKEIIDYVIIHELCHTIEMNHSKKFWELVGKYCPDYKILRREINNLG
jgi:predicted metal-dependent hydrolase